ncbi:MAG: hypothetical protein OWR62_08605 [Sulfobacillus thermotolerans]|nr:hypothetical protein [Sulfobacillus thermotolerans]
MRKFLAVEDMHHLCAGFAMNHNDSTYRVVGHSREHHAIHLLTIDHMPESALFLGFPHPNEPLMSLVLPSLLQVAHERQHRGQHASWLIVPVWDIDGVRLNREWWTQITDHIALKSLLDQYFRPAPNRQVEWTFPIRYQDYQFTTPLPETKAVMAIIDRYEPQFLFSLHNALFPEGYVFLDKGLQDVAGQASTILAAHSGVRLQNPVPYVDEWAPSVYGLPHITREIDYYKEQNIPLPINYGGASFDYGVRSQSVVVEIPIFARQPQDNLKNVSKDLLKRHWQQFSRLLDKALMPMVHADSIPLLVSNPYYFEMRLRNDLPLIYESIDRLDETQLRRKYQQDVFTMAVNLAAIQRQYDPTHKGVTAFLSELETMMPERLSVINTDQTVATYRDILGLIFNR